jgi:hypothetical protein
LVPPKCSEAGRKTRLFLFGDAPRLLQGRVIFENAEPANLKIFANSRNRGFNFYE